MTVRNTRIWSAMNAAGLTYVQLAEKVGVDPKTVQRWYYEGRVPRRVTARRVAQCLGVELAWLWSDTSGRPADPAGPGDLFELCAYAASLSDAFWRCLVLSARQEIFVVTRSEWLLSMLGVSPGGVLATRAAAGVAVRMLVSPDTVVRGPLDLITPKMQVRAHAGIDESSLVRADSAMVVICGGAGLDTASAPTLYLGQTTTGGPFDRYAQGFERLWQQSTGSPDCDVFR